jgi:predicted HicB family RNase H-like nuclease
MSTRPRTLRESVAIAPDATPAAHSFGSESQEGKEAAEVARRGVLVRVSPETRRALKLAAIERGTSVQRLLLEAITSILHQQDPTPAP